MRSQFSLSRFEIHGLSLWDRRALLGRLSVICVLLLPVRVSGQANWQACSSGGGQCLPTGNVGIGTASPGMPLQVISTNGNTARFTSAGDGVSWLYFNDNSAASDVIIGSRSGGFAVQTGGAGRFVINSSGNVGIGTTNPAHRLHVAGTIGAQEVIVSTTGADYVFNPNYHLVPLAEVASYINKNHHLPDIPSEPEVREKGVSLGEMQAKLLAKIEELTLHMIAEHERNDQLERENRKLKDDIETRLTQIEVGQRSGLTASVH